MTIIINPKSVSPTAIPDKTTTLDVKQLALRDKLLPDDQYATLYWRISDVLGSLFIVVKLHRSEKSAQNSQLIALEQWKTERSAPHAAISFKVSSAHAQLRMDTSKNDLEFFIQLSDQFQLHTLHRRTESPTQIQEMTTPLEEEEVPSIENLCERISQGELPVGSFISAVEQIDWSNASVGTFMTAIEAALSLELPSLAGRLAEQGKQTFPNNEMFEDFARILAPPVVRKSNRPANPSLALFTKWYQANADNYQGQWVALKGDTLIGSATSRQELLSKYTINTNDPNVFITQVF